MPKFSVIIFDQDKYKELLGVELKKGTLVEHDTDQIKILLEEKAITIPELTKRILEKKKKKIMTTPEEQQNAIVDLG